MSKKSSRPKTSSTATAPQDSKDLILLAALPDVAFDGWHDGLIAAAAAKCDISVEDAEKLFPAGTTDLVLHFSDWADARMVERLEKKDLSGMKVRDKIALGVRTRLEVLAPWKQAVSTALAHMGLPPRNLHLPPRVWQTADHIWWIAGDTATDYNHYTKRILLSGVISTTTCFWLSDDSDAHADSWRFLDRRIDNVLKLGKFLGTLGGKFRHERPTTKEKTRA